MTIQSNHQLLIMRHAKSDWVTGTDHDFDRPLSERGTGDAVNVGKWLSEQGLVIDLLISSPATRAKQTAIIVSRQLRMDTEAIAWEQVLYEAKLADLLGAIGRYAARYNNILLIGHNPGLDGLLCFLARDEPDRTASGKLMTTATLAILDYGTAPVSVNQHSAYVKSLIRPKQLR